MRFPEKPYVDGQIIEKLFEMWRFMDTKKPRLKKRGFEKIFGVCVGLVLTIILLTFTFSRSSRW